MKFLPQAALFLVVAAASLLLLQKQEKQFQNLDQAFLDQLVSLAGPKKDTTRTTLLRVRPKDLESGKLEPRLDWAILMNSLLHFEPKSAGLIPPLRWDDSDLLTEGALSKQVKRMPQMALGAILTPSASGAPSKADTASFAVLEQIEGDPGTLLQAKHVAAMPDEELLINGKPGFTHIELEEENSRGPNGFKLPLICRLGDKVVPSFVLQLIMIHEGLLPGDITIDLESPRPSVAVGDDLRVPIDAQGQFEVYHGTLESIPQVDFASLALALSQFPEVAEKLRKASQEDLDTLRSNAVVVGFDEESLRQFELPSGAKISRAQLLSMGIASIQRGFHITNWSPPMKYGSWGVLAILGLFALTRARWLAFLIGLAATLLYLGFSLIVFQQTLSWTPPWGALCLGILILVLGIALPRKARR